eukprot:10680571-Alexandrium_andersonii.AAC.1
MHCTLTNGDAVINVVVVHESASADVALRRLRAQWVTDTVTALGAEARVILAGDWNADPHESDMVVPTHTLGLRTAAPSCPTRWEGS